MEHGTQDLSTLPFLEFGTGWFGSLCVICSAFLVRFGHSQILKTHTIINVMFTIRNTCIYIISTINISVRTFVRFFHPKSPLLFFKLFFKPVMSHLEPSGSHSALDSNQSLHTFHGHLCLFSYVVTTYQCL